MSSFLKYTPLPKKQLPPKSVQKTLFHNKHLRLPFKKPTSVQKEIIHHILSSKSACFISSTGSGKSYGYVIGTLLKYTRSSFSDKKTVIVLPTRELVEQIYSLFKEFKKSKTLRVLSLSSKYSEQRDKNKLLSNPHVIITTPGRFPLVRSYQMLILDEIDLLLREGFVLPEKRPFQIICTSATISAKYFQQIDLKMVHLDDIAEKTDINLFMRREEKAHALLGLTKHFKQIIVFCSSRSRVDEIFDFLQETDFKSCGAIHSDIDTTLRQQNCQKFLKQKIDLLITTDLASRGLNMNSECIVHYDISDSDTMIHRRGRCKKNGTVITFYTLFELKYFSQYSLLRPRDIIEPLPQLFGVGGLKSKDLNNTSENSYNKFKRMLPPSNSTIEASNLLTHDLFKNVEADRISLKNKIKETINVFKRVKSESTNIYKDQLFIPYKK